MRPSCSVQMGSSASGTERRARAATFRTTSGSTGDDEEGMPRIVRLNARSAERKAAIVERRSKKVSSRGKRLLSEGRRRLQGLARRAELRTLLALALRSGQRGWIAGGALRELLLSGSP